MRNEGKREDKGIYRSKRNFSSDLPPSSENDSPLTHVKLVQYHWLLECHGSIVSRSKAVAGHYHKNATQRKIVVGRHNEIRFSSTQDVEDIHIARCIIRIPRGANVPIRVLHGKGRWQTSCGCIASFDCPTG